jgi:hypothetical protein
MAVLSFAAMGLLQLINVDLDETIAFQQVMYARLAANSGAAIASHPQLPANQRKISGQLPQGSTFEAVQSGEGGRLNINAVLAYQRRDVLDRLLKEWGLSDTERSTVIDCLLDFVEPGDLRRLNGAKRQQYAAIGRPNLPPGKPFSSAKEMELVYDFKYVIRRKPDWQDYFTVWSSGSLDLNSAPPDLIAAITGVPIYVARSFVEKRNGPDGILGTADDRPYRDPASARSALGLTEVEWGQLGSQIALQSDVRRVVSAGKFGTVTRTVVVTFRISSGSSEVLKWEVK